MKLKKRKDLVESPIIKDTPLYNSVKYYPVLTARADDAPNFSMRLFEIGPEGNTSMHRHSYEHEVYVVEGDGILVVEGDEMMIESGDFILIQQLEKHQLKAGKEGIAFVCVVPNFRKNYPE